ncbi:MAG: M56 family metallopeptidase [Mucilaginibacter sp.]|uniref:M56 family metallopeptidase n=1 Tax=Mucilaginibacter sp. TaxID=1882438 RepID=UPI003265C36D
MQTLFDQYSQVLGITLLHSLWQGLIIYALLRMVLLCIPSATSANKYNVALLALTASILWPLATLLIEISKHQTFDVIIDNKFEPLDFVPLAHTNAVSVPNTWSVTIDHFIPYLVVLWFIGIILNSTRLLWGWRNIYHIKQNVINDPAFQESVQLIAQLLQIPQKTKVFLSDHIDVPCIIGYLKPMVILPTAIITQFSAEQIKSILVHEMAHIRRNDYIINLLQQFIGILFFFNPFTHLINKIIYSEREHSCDDLVLQVTGEPLVYAQTLLQLEENRAQNFQLALAATGKKYHLLNRIKRIMETKKQASNIRHILAAVLLLMGSMGTIAWLNPEIKDGKVTISPAGKLPFFSNLTDTTKKASVKPKKVKHTGSHVAPGKIAFPKPKSVSAKVVSHDLYTDNPILDKLSAEVDKQAKELEKVYHSAQYRSIEKQMELKGRTLDSIYNNPQLKKLQEDMEQQSKAFNKINESLEVKEIEEKMEKLGKNQSAYFNTPEYKKLQKNFDNEGKWFEKENASKSPDFQAHSDALKKAGEELRNYTSNSQFKTDNEQIREYSKKMQEYYSSPEYKKQREELNKTSQKIREAFNDPVIKQQQKELNALSKKMRDYTNGPDIKKQKELFNQARARLVAYTNSPAFKKLREETIKNLKAMNGNYTYNTDTVNKGSK